MLQPHVQVAFHQGSQNGDGSFSDSGSPCPCLRTTAAFHTEAVTPEVLARFAELAAPFQFAAPQLPLACNVSGGYAGAEVAQG